MEAALPCQLKDGPKPKDCQVPHVLNDKGRQAGRDEGMKKERQLPYFSPSSTTVGLDDWAGMTCPKHGSASAFMSVSRVGRLSWV